MSNDPRNCTPTQAIGVLYPIVNEVAMQVVMPPARVRDSQRTGGYFAFWRNDVESGLVVPVIGFPVGVVPPDRALRYAFLANEKCRRLGERPDEISSWQSRDESDTDDLRKKWGGGIRCDRTLFFAFSGITEHEDEMVCVIVARQLHLIDDADVGHIITASGNNPLRTYRAAHPILGA